MDLFDYIKHDGPSGQNQYMGLLRGEDYSPKPAFFALQTLCTLFDAATRRWQASMFFERSLPDRPALAVNPALIRTAAFRRGDTVLYAYWMPADFDQSFPGVTVPASVWHGAATPWQEPVLIDPVQQIVYRLPADSVDPAGGAFRLPLLDGPLLLTDGAAIAMQRV